MMGRGATWHGMRVGLKACVGMVLFVAVCLRGVAEEEALPERQRPVAEETGKSRGTEAASATMTAVAESVAKAAAKAVTEQQAAELGKAIKAELGYGFREVEPYLVIIEHENGVGSGFLGVDGGQTHIYTNQHVILGCDRPMFKTLGGAPLKVVGFEVSTQLDVARFRVEGETPGLAFAEQVDMDAPVAVFGNSGGGGVFTELYGRVQGVGPERVEISAEFVQGNSGSPVLDGEMRVAGIATYATLAAAEGDWLSGGTRFAEARRFGLRVGPGHAWEAMGWQKYLAQGKELTEQVRYIEILMRLTADWFNNPVREFDKASYPHRDAATWIGRHSAGMSDYRSTVRKGRVRNERDLERRNQKVRDALTNDYRQLAALFRKRAAGVKGKAARGEIASNRFLKEHFTMVAEVMEGIAERIERDGEERVRQDVFSINNMY